MKWLLTWQLLDEKAEDKAKEAEASVAQTTVISADGKRKAKARLVMLGFAHPELIAADEKVTASSKQLHPSCRGGDNTPCGN